MISAHYLPHAATHRFSPLVVDYLHDAGAFKDFIAHLPDFSGIENAIEARRAFPTDREGLYEELKRQYSGVEIGEKVAQNLELLRAENTFTICTAHQPALFTGALYFVYKIIHTARLAADLKARFPQNNFVPVFYIGSEDNDLEELGHFQLGEKSFQWDGGGQTGAVGRMKTDALQPLLKEVLGRIGPPGEATERLVEILQDAYAKGRTIAEATRRLVNSLLGDFGVVVVDGDSAFFKAKMTAVFEEDLFHHKPYELVTAQSEALGEKYPAQAFPRPINLFYLDNGIRQRIEKDGDAWVVTGTDIRWTEPELRDLLAKFPQKFSPNVVLRGLFQETILPDVAFIGGGAEVAYWMQLAPLFSHYGVPFPVIVLRQSVQWIDGKARGLMEKTGLTEAQLFENPEDLLKEYTRTHAVTDWNPEAVREAIAKQLQPIFQKAAQLDPTLEAYGAARQKEIDRVISGMEKKIFRAEKRRHDVWYDRVLRLQKALSLDKGLEERRLTFLDFYPTLGQAFLQALYDHTRSFGDAFLILETSDL